MKKVLIIIVIIAGIGVGLVWLIQGRPSKNTNTSLAKTNAASQNLNAETAVTETNTANSNAPDINVNQPVNDSPVNDNLNLSLLNQNTNVTAPASIQINIDNLGFAPATARIALNGTVLWLNTDSVQHYVAPDDHPTHMKYAQIWDDDGTGLISPGATYQHVFTKAGTYTYHDHKFPNFTGEVIVE